MARSPDPDDWLDAFDLSDLDDPELARLDQATSRLAGACAPRPRRAPVAVALAAGLLLAAIAASILLAPEPLPAPAQAPPAEVALPPSPAPLAPTPVEAPSAPRVRPRLPAPGTPVVEAPPEEAPAPRPGPGLLPGTGAQLVVEGGVASLASGLLTYVHDPTHEPGVREVSLVSLPISLRPVGTAFSAHARPYVGALRVTSGVVQIVHDDGTLLAELGAGQEAVSVTDLNSPAEVRVIHTTGLPLDALSAQLPSDCLCHPRDVVAAVASVRFAARPASPATPEVP